MEGEHMEIDTQTPQQPSQDPSSSAKDTVEFLAPLVMSVHLGLSTDDEATVTFPAPSHVYALFAGRADPSQQELTLEPPLDLMDPTNLATVQSHLRTIGQKAADLADDNSIESFVKTLIPNLSRIYKWNLTDDKLFLLEPKYPSDTVLVGKSLTSMGKGVVLPDSSGEAEENLNLYKLGHHLSELYGDWEQALEQKLTTDDGTYAVISFFADDSENVTEVGLHFKPLTLHDAKQVKSIEVAAGAADSYMMEE